MLPLQPSLNYTAPELVRSRDTQIGCAVDIFSLACVSYHLLAHKPLLDCNNNVKMVRRNFIIFIPCFVCFFTFKSMALSG